MMENNIAAPVQGTSPLSTSIDQGGAPLGQGGGVPNLNEPKAAEAPKPVAKAETPGDTLKGELARIRDEEAKEAEKVKAKGEDAAKDAKAKADEALNAEKEKGDEKPAKQRDETGKFAKADTGVEPEAEAGKGEPEKAATGQGETDKSRQSEGQKYHEPPARFLPKAKEVWANVPHAVKGEIARMSQEHEAEVTKYKQAGERYEPIRQFDEIAKSNGRELKDSLAKVVQVENALQSNPIAGLDMILREIGPKRANGQPLSLMDVVQHIAQNPQAYQQAINSLAPSNQNQQQRQSDPEVQALKQQIEEMRNDQVAQSVIVPFAAQNPRFRELQEDIAFFLNSGKIPASLTPQERLEAAYDMAVRINPTSSVAPSQAREALADAKPAPSDDAGAKSIRGAPNGQDPDEDDPDATDIRKLLRREMRKAS